MAWYYWLIVLVPFAFVIGMAFHTRRYIRDVVDFLAAGRIAGRYVICVADLGTGLGLITLIAYMEASYKTGFSVGFWGAIIGPFWLLLSLTGFFSYRFRETRAMTIGEYLEARYSRRFRIFASTLRTTAEMFANMICPAVAARFFIYLLGWPTQLDIWGMHIETFSLVMLLTLTFALTVIWAGGQIALIVTDAIQMMICYPIFLIFTFYILFKFSWFHEIVPTMFDRAPGESFMNPFDIKNLRDFNLFAILVTIMTGFLNRGSWAGGGSDTAAKSPHEQKMAGILGSWRNGFAYTMQLLLAVALIVFLNNADFAPQAHQARIDLTRQIVNETEASNPQLQAKVMNAVQNLPAKPQRIGIDPPLSIKKNLDTRYFETVGTVYKKELGDAKGNAKRLEFQTLFHQQMLPVAFRSFLPGALLALFCLFGLLLMLSTDDSRIFSSARTIAQDIIMPLLRNPISIKHQLWLIRGLTLFVCICFFVGSYYLSQLQYLTLYSVIMCSIWLGGAGPVVLGGLYTRFGTTWGAYASLFAGASISTGGILIQRNWPDYVYPWLDQMGWTGAVGTLLQKLSAPFDPIIHWEMDPVRFPINSQEIFFIAMSAGIISYVLVSFATCRKLYNLDKLLHRGKYDTEGKGELKTPWNWRTFWPKVIGITPDYTKGDKIIAWSVFLYSFVYATLFCFVAIVLWNLVSPWPLYWWGYKFFITMLVVPCIIGIASTVWFSIGGIMDLRKLFIDLKARAVDYSDNGSIHDQDRSE